MRLSAAVLLGLCVAMPAKAEDPAWSALSRSDLQAIHDLIRDNHPGPVDPENPRFRDWLEQGLTQALARAAGVRSYFDYVRSLRFYTNGFQDGHIGIGLDVSSQDLAWPGFVVGASADGTAEVLWTQPDLAGVRVGDRIAECDGRSIDELMAERVDPFFWNRAIPHERFRHVHRLFHADAGDRGSRLDSCRLSSGAVPLAWRRIRREELDRTLESVRGSRQEPRLREAGELWIATIPTFAYPDAPAVERIRAFLADVQANAEVLRRSTVVLDVRGNHGGSSGWGEEVASALWGANLVKWVVAGLDETADWRASDRNIEHMTAMLARETAAGLSDSADYCRRAIEAMKAARARSQPLGRVEDHRRRADMPPSTPMTGRVLFLTDGECASACLDFADLVRRLPGTLHVGLPTSADAIYIDNTYAPLPSGLSGLGYSMKVYRNRARGNNEWYEPNIRWPGGPMTEAALTRWLTELASR